jgi:hypothetical protein
MQPLSPTTLPKSAAVDLLRSVQTFNQINSALEEKLKECSQAKLDLAEAKKEKAVAMAELNSQAEEIYRLFQELMAQDP